MRLAQPRAAHGIVLAVLGALALAVASCASLLEPAVQPDGTPFADRIDQPVEIKVPGQDATVTIDPGGGVSLKVEGDAELALEAPISFPVSGFPGYQVVLQPDGSVSLAGPPGAPAEPRPTTVADVAVDVAAPFVVAGSALGGNPMLGTLAVGALRALVGVFASRKRQTA